MSVIHTVSSPHGRALQKEVDQQQHESEMKREYPVTRNTSIITFLKSRTRG